MTYSDQERTDILQTARLMGQFAASLRSGAKIALNPSQRARETLAEGLRAMATHADAIAATLARLADEGPEAGP